MDWLAIVIVAACVLSVVAVVWFVVKNPDDTIV